jgi:hypothetical protein
MNSNEHFIFQFTLAQRQVVYEYRKQHNLNRADIELMCFALKNGLFTTYYARKVFPNTNPQQTIKQIKKLVDLKVLYLIPKLLKAKSSLYSLSIRGEGLLNEYFSALENRIKI